MTETLTAAELAALVARVFVPTPEDRSLGVMIDLPDARVPDDAAWVARRKIAAEWVDLLETQADVDALVDALRAELEKARRNNERVQVR